MPNTLFQIVLNILKHAATSVTRWWNKKLPNIGQKVSKSFLHESCSIWNSPKVTRIFGFFCKKIYYQEHKKSANLVTLAVTNYSETNKHFFHS